MKTTNWSINVDETPYEIQLQRNKISINNQEAMPLRKLQKKMHLFETEYYFPIGAKQATLHCSSLGKATLVVDGRDCLTGNEYVPIKVPAWAWIFVVLHCINYFLFIGGAIGVALDLILITVTANISADKSKNIGIRVLLCTAVYIAATLFECILSGAIYNLIYG